jgi:hypothetical protein
MNLLDDGQRGTILGQARGRRSHQDDNLLDSGVNVDVTSDVGPVSRQPAQFSRLNK